MLNHKTLVYTICLLFCFSKIFGQFNIPAKPNFETSVYDGANILNANEKKQLESKLIKYSDSTSTQIVLITILSTNGENINYLGANWGEKWGIGQKQKDNGILILLAKNDRRIAINTGRGVEHLLTDAMSRRIIERHITPYFKQGNYYGGLNNGITAIFKVMTGEYKNTQKRSQGGSPVAPILFVIIFFTIVFIIIIKGNKRGGGNNNGSLTDVLDTIILSNSGRSGYRRSSGGFSGGSSWGGSSSGGGFSGGFGGGSFGGGGASGGW